MGEDSSAFAQAPAPAAPSLPRGRVSRILGLIPPGLRLPLVLAGALAVLVLLFYAEENWRGRRAWVRYRREQAARGIAVEWKNVKIARAPEEKNFARTPFLQAVIFRGQSDARRWAPFANASRQLPLGAWGNCQTGYALDWEAAAFALGASTNLAAEALREHAAAAILRLLEPLEPTLDELRASSRREFTQFADPGGNPFDRTKTADFMVVRSLTQILGFHACADVALGREERALADLRVIHALARGMIGGPTLVDHMIGVALHGHLQQVFWEGWAARRWDEKELTELQAVFLSADLAGTLFQSLRLERAALNSLILEHAIEGRTPAKNPILRNVIPIQGPGSSALDPLWEKFIQRLEAQIPRGWYYQNMVHYSRMMDALAPNLARPGPLRLSPSEAEASWSRGQSRISGGPFSWVASVGIPNFRKAEMTAARWQAEAGLAAIVCALERHRRIRGAYPETLQALAPQLLDAPAADPIGGQPMRYRRIAPDRFLLYSVGWNERDDDGRMALRPGSPPSVDLERGDWVWAWPQEREPSAEPPAARP